MSEETTYQTKFNSALPLIIILRNAIFGKTKPDGYTRLTFYVNTLLWFMFLVWHLLSYFAFSLRDLIFEEKNIDVTTLIYCRGEELGFEASDFLIRILQLHIYSALAWGIFFIALALLWRKNKWSVFVFLLALVLYYYLLIGYMSLSFFNQDITYFDKALLTFIGCNLLVYFLVNRWKIKRNIAFQSSLEEQNSPENEGSL